MTLTITILPLSLNTTVGNTIHFTSTVEGGVEPYSYYWGIVGVTIGGDTHSETFTYTFNNEGVYEVYLEVLDSNGGDVSSELTVVTVTEHIEGIYTFDELLELDLDSNVPCSWCGKNMILKEAVIEGVDIDHIYLLCGFCKNHENFTKVEEAYNEELDEEWLGLNPKGVSYL